MRCDRCSAEISPEEAIPQGNRTVCEDCAMTLLSPPKACDPWAVKAASGSFKTKGDAVASLQGAEKALYELVKTGGRLRSEDAPARLSLTPDEVRRAFTVLRHMELLRGDRRADGGTDFILFEN